MKFHACYRPTMDRILLPLNVLLNVIFQKKEMELQCYCWFEYSLVLPDLLHIVPDFRKNVDLRQYNHYYLPGAQLSITELDFEIALYLNNDHSIDI